MRPNAVPRVTFAAWISVSVACTCFSCHGLGNTHTPAYHHNERYSGCCWSPQTCREMLTSTLHSVSQRVTSSVTTDLWTWPYPRHEVLHPDKDPFPQQHLRQPSKPSQYCLDITCTHKSEGVSTRGVHIYTTTTLDFTRRQPTRLSGLDSSFGLDRYECKVISLKRLGHIVWVTT